MISRIDVGPVAERDISTRGVGLAAYGVECELIDDDFGRGWGTAAGIESAPYRHRGSLVADG